MPARLVIIDDADQFSGQDAYRIELALTESARRCWRAWRHMLEPEFSDGPPTVFSWGGEPLPEYTHPDPLLATHIPIYMTDSLGRSDSLAVHYHTGLRPQGDVYLARGTGLYNGHMSGTEAWDHESHEILVNPLLGRWAPHPSRQGWVTPVEVDDPLQAHYMIDGVSVSNFVFPAYFGLRNHPEDPAEQLDFLGELSTPGQLAATGYRLAVKEDWTEVDYEWGPSRVGFGSAEMAALHRPLSRTRRLAQGCAERQP